jgi:hypothetical protein
MFTGMLVNISYSTWYHILEDSYLNKIHADSYQHNPKQYVEHVQFFYNSSNESLAQNFPVSFDVKSSGGIFYFFSSLSSVTYDKSDEKKLVPQICNILR